MRTTTTVALTVIRLTGLIQIVLGLLFWTGNARDLVSVHMLVGFTLVLTLWVLAALAARAGIDPGFVALALLWGVLVLGLGLTQQRLLPGDGHWVIQVLHLILGLVAIGQGEALATRMTHAGSPDRDLARVA